MYPVFIQRVASVAQRAVGLPEVAQRHFLAVALTDDGLQGGSAVGGVGHAAVVPPGSCCRDGQPVACGGNLPDGCLVHRGDGFDGAVGEVEHVGSVVGIGHVVGHEAHEAFIAAFYFEAADEFVDAHLVEKAQVGVAVAAQVRGLDVVRGEVAEQGALDPPLGIGRALCGYVADFRGHGSAECQRLVGAVELAADEFKVNQQSLLVVDDLGLLGVHPHVGSIAVADVVDEECELSLFARFDSGGQGVVAHHVALHEVGEVEVGRGLDGEGDGHQLARHADTGEGVGVREGASEGVGLLNRGGGVLGGDEEYRCHTGLLRVEGPSAVKVQLSVKAAELFGADLELTACGQRAVLVLHGEVELHVGHGVHVVAVEHGQRATECLARHHHLLRELEGDGGADGGRSRFCVFFALLIRYLKEVSYRFVSIGSDIRFDLLYYIIILTYQIHIKSFRLRFFIDRRIPSVYEIANFISRDILRFYIDQIFN